MSKYLDEKELRHLIEVQIWNIPNNECSECVKEATDQIMSLIKANCWLKGEQEMPYRILDIAKAGFKPCGKEWSE